MKHDDEDITKKFGYEAFVEKEKIRKQLIESGITNELELHFAVAREYDKAHANDSTYKEISEAFRAKWAANKEAVTILSKDELLHILFQNEHSNDPIAITLVDKIKKALATF